MLARHGTGRAEAAIPAPGPRSLPPVALLYPRARGFSGQLFAFEILARGLRERGHRVAEIRSPALRREAEPGGSDPGARYGSLGLPGFLLRTALAWLEALRRATDGSALVVNLGQTIAAFLRDGGPLLLLGFLRPHGNAVISLHGSWFAEWGRDELKSRLLRALARGARLVTVQGEILRQRLVALGIPRSKVGVVSNTCLLSPSPEEEIRAKHRRSPPLKVLYLSLLTEGKGYPEFVESIVRLAEADDLPIEATLCGRVVVKEESERFLSHAAAKDWIHALVERINRSSRVRLRWIDGTEGEAKEALLRESHALVLPSRREGQPIVILEAMAAGCVVAATPVGEIPSTIDDRSGMLLPDGSPAAVAGAIRELHRDPERRLSRALEARRRFGERYPFDRHIGRWEELLSAAAR